MRKLGNKKLTIKLILIIRNVIKKFTEINENYIRKNIYLIYFFSAKGDFPINIFFFLFNLFSICLFYTYFLWVCVLCVCASSCVCVYWSLLVGRLVGFYDKLTLFTSYFVPKSF